MDPKTMRRLGEIGEAAGAKAVVPIVADAWEIEGDTTGHSLGDYLRADRQGKLDSRRRITDCPACMNGTHGETTGGGT